MKVSLYDLPKDMLIKLITTLQDCKNLTGKQLLEDVERISQEIEYRKTRRIKEVLLADEKNNNYIDIINTIEGMKLRHSEGRSMSHLQVRFVNGTTIKTYINANEICSNLFSTDGKYICFLCGTNSVNWLHEQEEDYEIYVNFIHKVLYDQYAPFNYYLNAFVLVDYL